MAHAPYWSADVFYVYLAGIHQRSVLVGVIAAPGDDDGAASDTSDDPTEDLISQIENRLHGVAINRHMYPHDST